MDRIPYNLSHMSFVCGKIGALQTIAQIPVIGGDSISISMDYISTLSPLKRRLLVDADVDFYGFYVPHRHVYGDDWVNMLKEGADSAIVLDTIAVDVDEGMQYLGQPFHAGFGSVSKYSVTGYNQIWNRYFRYLKLTPEVPDTYNSVGAPATHTAANSPILGGLEQQLFGFTCARKKKPWNTGVPTSLVDDDHMVDLVAGNTKLDILDLIKTKMRYKTQVERDRFVTRYNDVMKNTFGSGVNIDADQRPELIMHERKTLSGYDVDGTGDANLGTYSGKATSKNNVTIRRKFIPEHGCIWIMMLVRFPTISTDEIHPLVRGSQDYTRLGADFDLVSAQEPYQFDQNEWLAFIPSAVTQGTIPYGQWYRTQPNYVNRQFKELDGFPFLKSTQLDTHKKAVYHAVDEWEQVFQTNQLGHWQVQAALSVEALRHYPTARGSIFAGVK